MTPIDQADMMNMVMTTALPSQVICPHMDIGSKPTVASWRNISAQSCIETSILSISCELKLSFRTEFFYLNPLPRLLRQSEIHIDLSHDFHRFPVEKRGLIP